MIDLFSGLALIFIFVAIGWMELRWLLRGASSLELAGLAFPLGAGTVTWSLFILSWIGIPIGWLSTATLAGLLFTALAWKRFRMRSVLAEGVEISWQEPSTSSQGGLFRWSMVAAWAVILLVAGMISVGMGHGSWDAAAGWVVKGYGIVHEGAASAGARWGAWGLSYPLNLPIQNGLFALVGAEGLPGSKLLPPMYLASLALTVAAFLRRQGVGWMLSGVAGLLLLTNPLLFRHGTIGYANLPLAAYLVPGVCLSAEGLPSRTYKRLLVGGVLVAMASWTRPEGIVYSLAILGGLAAASLMSGQSLRRILDLSLWLVPVVLLGGSWFIFGWTNVQSSYVGSTATGFMPYWMKGDFHLYELILIPKLLLKRGLIPERWGVLFPLSGVLFLIGGWKGLFPKKSPLEFTLLVLTILTVLVPISLFYLWSYGRSDFVALLHRSFDRAFIPAAMLLLSSGFVVAFGPAAQPPNPEGQRP